MATSTGFFAKADTALAINALSTGSLTIIAGAGVAAESRLPTWAQLVRGLLLRAADRLLSNPNDEQRASFADWALRTDGVLGAAALAQAAGQDKRSIARVLYESTGPNPVPGPSAHALARLAIETGVELVTPNYDTTLESALSAACGDATRVQSLVSDAASDESIFAVRHLHGVLSPTGVADGPIVLTEADYFAMGDTAWQARFVRDALERGPCLFVGTSMTDPNLLRYLHTAKKKVPHAHYAILAREGDPFRIDADTAAPVDSSVEDARRIAALRRWGRVNVNVLEPDCYYDSAQFLRELLLRRSGSVLGDYSTRLDAWQTGIDSVYLSDDQSRFSLAQDYLYEALHLMKLRVTELLENSTVTSSERFAIGLWMRQPGDTLLLIGSSDRVHRDRDTLDPLPLHDASRWTAIRAFRRGAPLIEDSSDRFGTRWNTVIAFPLAHESAEHGWLQVGAMTVAGTEPLAASALNFDRIGPDAFDELGRLVSEYGSRLLAPESAAR